MKTNKFLGVIALLLASIVGLSEIIYYLSHPGNTGVSGHLIGLSIAVILIAVAGMIENKEKNLD